MVEPSCDEGMVSMNSSQSPIVSTVMDWQQALYAYSVSSSIPPSKIPAARTARALWGPI